MRQQTGRQMTSDMQNRLSTIGITDNASLYAVYAAAGGDARSRAALEADGARKLGELRERGFELGGSTTPDARLEAIYQNARRALYARVEAGVIRDVCPHHIQVRTEAADRDGYLAHPPAGERVCQQDARTLQARYTADRPRVQIVVSDGLNANAINEQARTLLPAVRRLLADAGCAAADTDVIVQNGRVRAGYHIGALVEPAVIVHLIGERPGTGLNTVSAYLTYGRDEVGGSRWDPRLDHSCTTAVCGIHPQGKPPEIAAAEIARTTARILEQRRSGVALR